MIINLTQHEATPEQTAQGVVEPVPNTKERICDLLTFDSLPVGEDIEDRADRLAELASKNFPIADTVLIGGAPFLMSALERAVRARGFTPTYSFSQRESVEEILPDGRVVKKSTFKHIGFVTLE